MASPPRSLHEHDPSPLDPGSAAPSTPPRHNSPPSESSSRPESPTSARFRRRRWFRGVKDASPMAQSPLVHAVTLDHFKAGSSSCPELDQTRVHRPNASPSRNVPARRPSTSQPITPPRSIRFRDHIRWSHRSSALQGSPPPRMLTPPTFREGSPRRRKARDSSKEEGPAGEDACHDTVKEAGGGSMGELAVAGAMVAVFELDRLSGMARRVERRSGPIESEEENEGDG